MLHRILVLSFMLPVLLFAEEYGAVVKIFSVSSRPNYYLPWQNFSQRNASASGFVIEGRRIITNAHAVSYPTFITVRKLGDQTQYPARVSTPLDSSMEFRRWSWRTSRRCRVRSP